MKVAVMIFQIALFIGWTYFVLCDFTEEENPVTEAACALSEWGEWGECTPKCGPGIQFKERRYLNKKAKKRCEVIILTCTSCFIVTIY